MPEATETTPTIPANGQAEPEEVPAWEYGEVGLIITPGLEWEEWTSLWNTLQQTSESIGFWIGDAANAGEAQFGEQWAQVLDALEGENQATRFKQYKWVCSKIPPARRVKFTGRAARRSWSLHREVAALDPEQQDELLGLAEQHGWTTGDLKTEIQTRKLARRKGYPGNQPPSEAEPPQPDAPPEESLSQERPEAAGTEEAAPSPVSRGRSDDSTATPQPGHNRPPNGEAETSPIEDTLRGLIEEVRWHAPDLAYDKADATEVIALDKRISIAAAPKAGNLDWLMDPDEAKALIPDGWDFALTVTVELRRGEQLAVARGPSITASIVEAALAARLSDLGKKKGKP